jgi:2-dehydropantoate 2-reductase
MKIAVVGGGSIGSYLAAMFALGGNEVHLVCRGSQLDAIRSRGLVLKRGQESIAVPTLSATSDAASVDAADVVLMAVKLYDLASSTRQVKALMGPATLVVPIQNGVVAHEIIDRELGAGHSAGGTVFISAALEQPGVVVSRSKVDQIVFGEVDGTISPRAEAFRSACEASGLKADLSARIIARMWEKFVSIIGINVVCCLARQSVGFVRADERLTACLVKAMEEAVTVAQALRIDIAPDTIDRALAFGKHVAYDTRVSMLEDIEAGKPTEVEWLNGHLVKVAEQLGISVPMNELAYACLAQYSPLNPPT